MRQRHGGPKIINWHRPLAPWEHKRRYLRNRWAEVSEDDLIDPDEIEDQRAWDVYDPADPLDYAFYQALSYITNGIDAGGLKEALKQADILPETTLSSKSQTQKLLVSPGRDIEQRLHSHVNLLMKKGWVSQYMHEIAADKEDMRVLYAMARGQKGDGIKSYLLYLLFSPFWLRSPKSWHPSKNERTERNLVKHLFERYTVSDSLRLSWGMDSWDTRIKWILFYLILTQGGSLRRGATYFDWKLPKKFTLFLREAPENITPVEMVMFALIRCQGGTIVEFERLSRQPAYVYDPTGGDNLNRDDRFDKFWKATVVWLSRNREILADQTVDIILEWAINRFHWQIHETGQAFKWGGRTPLRVLEASRLYSIRRTQPWVEFVWESHNWDWVHIDENKNEWIFSELTSGNELFEEGERLHNCLRMYASRCAVGNSAIVSLKAMDEIALAIEIDPSSLEIVQVKGLLNRNPDEREQSIIQLWLDEVVRNVGPRIETD